MKMVRVAHLRTSALMGGRQVVVEEYGDWLPVSQIAAFKSGYTHADPPSGSPEQPVTSLVWVATIETVDGTIYEAPNPDVAREWHQQILGADARAFPEPPAVVPGAFQKKDMVVEKWPGTD